MKVKLLGAGAVLFVVAAPALVWLGLGRDRALRGAPRRAWKDAAIARIALRMADESLIESDLAEMKSKVADGTDYEAWVSDDLVLMKNGELIVYASVCQKSNRRIPDLFIGRSSDGKWYYTTYHFCIGMYVLRGMHGQPESLTGFIDKCYLKEFDGRSDDCLNRTWPPRE